MSQPSTAQTGPALPALIISFVVGAALVPHLPVLPPLAGWLLPVVACLCYFRLTRLIGSLCLGFCYAAWFAGQALDQRLPADLAGEDLKVTGVVSSLPEREDHLVRFRLSLTDCADCWSETTIALSWYQRGGVLTEPVPGEIWTLPVRLWRPRGAVNPGLFDYDGWMLAAGISASGYVRGETAVRVAGPGLRQWHHQARHTLRLRLREALAGSKVAGLAVALAIGVGSEIAPADWRVLSATGTNHLLIISGLHVGLVAVFSYQLLSRCLPYLMTSAFRWAAVGSLVLTLLYSCLAGLGLPVQRALVMALVAFAGDLFDRHITLTTKFTAALLLVTLLNPLACLSPGFWLSFGAVFSLLFGFAGRPAARTPGGLAGWASTGVRTQWIVTCGTLPLMLVLIGQFSLLSLFTNLIAIPWVSVAVVPVLLLSLPGFAVHTSVGTVLAELAGWSLAGLWHLLSWAAALRWVYFTPDIGPVVVVLGGLGGVLMLSPRGFLPRWPGLLLLATLATPGRDAVGCATVHRSSQCLAPGEIILRVLDVGQGLATLVQTREETVIYDTGPRFGDRYDAGEQVVTPTLRLAGVGRYVAALVHSHGDVDHAGGAQSVGANFLIGHQFSQAGRDDEGCSRTRRLGRGPVRFELLANAGGAATGNNRSCILWVGHAQFAVLLPGDIEAEGEHHLLARGVDRATVVVAPHHGSASSSSPAFINRLQPGVVIFATGFGNRFGHPDAAVVNRYRRRGALLFNTATDGQVIVHYHPAFGVDITTARSEFRRFWYDD